MNYIVVYYAFYYPFSTTCNISILANNSSFTSLFFIHACHVKPGADKECTESSSYI